MLNKNFGALLNEVVGSFSLVDYRPEINLEAVDLQVPGSDTYDFKVKVFDDRGIKKVWFNYDIERKGMIKNLITLKKKSMGT